MTVRTLLYDKGIRQNKVAEILDIDKSNLSKRLKKNLFTLSEIIKLRNYGILTIEDIQKITDIEELPV